MDRVRHFTLKWFIKDTLSDVDGAWSAKRATILIGLILFIVAFIASTFFHFTVDSAILNVLATIILTGIGATASERFGKKFVVDGDSSSRTSTITAVTTTSSVDPPPLASPAMTSGPVMTSGPSPSVTTTASVEETTHLSNIEKTPK
jgi:hypothetical protein